MNDVPCEQVGNIPCDVPATFAVWWRIPDDRGRLRPKRALVCAAHLARSIQKAIKETPHGTVRVYMIGWVPNG